MKYLYEFEDGRHVQLDNEPGPEEMESLEANVLWIYRFNPENGFFESLEPNGVWIPVDDSL